MTTVEASDSLLSKVRGLLTQAENPACTPEEAAAYNDKAAALIAKYGIDRAMLAVDDPTSDVVGDRVITIVAPYAIDKRDLLAAVAHALRCRAIYRKIGGSWRVHLFGFASDLERTELLFTSLLVQASYGMAAARPDGYYETVAAYRRSWLEGFRHEIGSRLRRAEQQAQTEASTQPSGDKASGTSVELVLVDRQATVQRAVSEAYPRLKQAAPRRLSGSGYFDGREAGVRADLGGTRVGQRSRTAVTG